MHRSTAALGLVALGGAVGASARYAVLHGLPTGSDRLSWATLSVNLVGSLILGCLLEALTQAGPDVGGRQRVRLLVGTGFCGALTTYSTLAHELVSLAQTHAMTALAWAVSQVILGIVMAGVGAWLGSLTQTRQERA